jgi:hypothetical protein
MEELWQVYQACLYLGHWESEAPCSPAAFPLF